VCCRILLLLSLVLFCNSSFAERRHALGLVIGDVTGPSYKYRLSRDRSIDGQLSLNASNLRLRSRYLFEFPRWIKTTEGPIAGYFGLGGAISEKKESDSEKDKSFLGLSAPAGAKYQIPKHNIEVFGEIVLNLYVSPETDTDVVAALGFRVLF